MCTRARTHTHTQRAQTFIYIKTFTETRGLHRQLTLVGYSQTQILESNPLSKQSSLYKLESKKILNIINLLKKTIKLETRVKQKYMK